MTNDQLQDVLNSVWEKSLPLLRQRVTVLESAAQASRAEALSDELRIEASEEAHRLAGLLGTFGYPEGTDAARILELFFDPALEGAPVGTPRDPANLAAIENSVKLLRNIVGA